MAITAISYSVFNTRNSITTFPSFQRVTDLYRGNSAARQELQGATILIDFFSISGTMIAGLLSVAWRSFSISRFMLGGLVGGLIGGAAALPLIWSFSSRLNHLPRLPTLPTTLPPQSCYDIPAQNAVQWTPQLRALVFPEEQGVIVTK